MNPKNTVFDAKRLIGRHFSESVVQDDMKHFSFTVKVRQRRRPRDARAGLQFAAPTRRSSAVTALFGRAGCAWQGARLGEHESLQASM
jgi:hypothetical protein